MNEAYTKFAEILRITPESLMDFDKKMISVTGKKGVFEAIYVENTTKIEEILTEFNIAPKDCEAENVYGALLQRLTEMDNILYKFLGRPDLTTMSESCGKLCEIAQKISTFSRGFFVKRERAIELLEEFPPQNLLNHFRHKTVEQLIDNRGFASVFASLRFAQDNDWMHEFFTVAYSKLTPDDFEERNVELKVLETEWLDVAEKFLKKKYHNVSHLKEMGIIFITPLTLNTAGETTRMFMLLLHYLNEVPFYSKLFRKYAEEPNFIQKLQSLLRGDVPEIPVPEPPEGKTISFRVIQRYLAKDNENDFRLLEPHVNPEAEHWYKAEQDLGKLETMIENH